MFNSILLNMVQFFSGSRTVTFAVQVVMLVSKAYDKGIKDSSNEIAGFVYDRLDDGMKGPEGPVTLEELEESVIAISQALKSIYNLFHK